MKGVTYTTFCAFRRSKGLQKPTMMDLKNISDKEWDSVLRWHTWDKANLDKIKDEWIAYLLADCVWMSGTGYLKRVQSLLGLKADGIIGPVSIAKINSMTGENLFNILWNQRKNFLQGIAQGKNSVFLKGWMRRLNCVRHGYLLTSAGKYLK